MDSIIFLAYAAAYLALLIWGLSKRASGRDSIMANLPLFVVAALFYDNLVLGSGSFIGQGNTLESLNAGRYWLTLFTPFLFMWAIHSIQRAGLWRGNGLKWFAILGGVVLMFVTFAREISGLTLKMRDEFGSLSYISAEPVTGPPLVPVIVAIILLIAGAIIWRRQGWPWLFAASALMTMMSFVELAINSNAATNLFELLLLVSIVATTAFQNRHERMQRL